MVQLNILVTGGCGFIGSHLVRRLVKQGHSVRSLDTHLTGHPSNLGEARSSVGCIQAGVTNWDAVRRAVRGCDVVYHLAARMDWCSNRARHPISLTVTNVQGTSTVLAEAAYANVRKVIFTSSAAVYGQECPGKEQLCPVPVTVYGATKLMAENLCCTYTNSLDLPVTILRLFNVFGPLGRGVVQKFLESPDTACVYGDGTQTRDFVHVDDVVDALVAAMNWPSGIFNVGTGQQTSILDLWRLLIPNREPVFEAAPEQDITVHSCACLEKVSLLWQPKRRLECVQ